MLELEEERLRQMRTSKRREEGEQRSNGKDRWYDGRFSSFIKESLSCQQRIWTRAKQQLKRWCKHKLRDDLDTSLFYISLDLLFSIETEQVTAILIFILSD